jgi:O-antigen/teichoic acid export membrane protein
MPDVAPETLPASGADSMGSRIRIGLAWKAGSQIILQISRMVVALVLARMLAPHDWGLAAMVLVFSGFVVVFTDSALGTALIQRRDLRAGDRSTVFWSSAAIGLLLTVGGIAFAGPLASFYGEPEIRPLFAALSVGFFISALGTTQSALFVRDLQFRLLELRAIAATMVGATAGIAVAVADYGAWAIVVQQLAEATTSTILLWHLSPWRPSATFSFASLRRLGGFAGNVFGENLLYQAGRNISALLLGRFLGAASVGTYALATNVILVPFSRIAGPLQQVFFPAFSRMSDDRARVADVWIRATRLVGAISIPSLVGLVIVAPDFVQVVLGPRWSDATVVIQILAWVGIIQSLQTLNGEVLLALDRSGWLLRFTMLWFAGSVAAFAIGVQWGIVGVAVSYAVATTLIEPVRTYLTTRALGISPFAIVRSLSGVAQATALMAIAVLAARMALVATDFPTAARLLVLVVLGAAVYLACCLWRAPEITLEIRNTLARRRKPQARIEAAAAPL